MSGPPSAAEVRAWPGTDTLRTELRDRVFLLTLNRPDARNAITQEMVGGFHRVLGHLEQVDSGVVVVQGAGGRAFASGADIGELLGRGRDEALAGINSKLFARLERLPLVTIAAVEGYALGGGCELALACDLRVAGAGAVFGQPEVALGIIPGAGGAWRLTRLLGLSRAKDLVLTGRRVDASEAKELGLVHRLGKAGEALDLAMELAGRIGKLDPLALRCAKEILNASPDASAEALDALSVNTQAILFESPGKRERMSHFLKKRS